MNNEALIPDTGSEEVSAGGQTQLAQPPRPIERVGGASPSRRRR